MGKDSGILDPKVIELQEIYREMDAEGKETMVKAADKLLHIQKNFKNQNNFKGKKIEAHVQRQLLKRRFMDIAKYLVPGIVLACAIYFFWETMLNPALQKIGITPLAMVRIILTALIGILCLASGLVGFLQRWIKVPWTFLLIVAGIGCIDPRILTDFIGISLIALVIKVLVFQKKHEKASVAG